MIKFLYQVFLNILFIFTAVLISIVTLLASYVIHAQFPIIPAEIMGFTGIFVAGAALGILYSRTF